MNLLVVSFFPRYDIYYMFKSTYLEDGLVTLMCPLGRSPKNCWIHSTIPYEHSLQMKALALIQHGREMLLPGGAYEQTPESWATYSERVVGGTGGSSSGPCWRRQHGQSCWKDAKCAEVQPRDQIGLLLGIKMEKKLRGGDLRGPACLGQPPSLAWVAPGSPNQSAPPRPRGPLPHRVAGVSSPDLSLTVASLQRFSAALRVSTHLNTASKASPGDPGHLTSISPANPLPPLCLVVLLSLLWTPPTHCLPCKKCASLPPHLATSYSSCGFHLSLGVPSSRKPSLTPKASAQGVLLTCPRFLTTAGITWYLNGLCSCLSPF